MRLVSPQHFDQCNDAYSLSIRVKTTLKHISIFLNHNINVKGMFFFFRARAEKGIARHIDVSSVVWILIDNGKLANQIVVKYSVTTVYFAVTISHVLLLS